MRDKIAKNLIRDVEKKIEKTKPCFSTPIEIVLTFQHMFHSRCNASTVQRITGINERWEAGEREEKNEKRRRRRRRRRVTFKTVLRNLSDLVYFRRYRCHARSVTVALNQQWHELSRGLRSRKAIYVTRENVNDSWSSSSMLSRSLG